MDVETLALVHQLYGAQSHFIDNGDARAWAGTFTPDGEFHSPSYPEPVVGTGNLIRFAEDFAAQDGTARHVITNLFVQQAAAGLTVRAYLQIVHTPPGTGIRVHAERATAGAWDYDGLEAVAERHSDRRGPPASGIDRRTTWR